MTSRWPSPRDPCEPIEESLGSRLAKLCRDAFGRDALGRRTIILLAVVAAASAFVAHASAAEPFIGTFPLNETFVDDGASAACGFPVTSTITGTVRFQVFFDQSGNPVRLQFEGDYSGTFSANGRSVNQTSHAVSIVDLVTGTETDVGLIIRVSLSDGGTLYLDRGRLVVDADGNVVFEAGPHPSLHGDFPGLCAALTP